VVGWIQRLCRLLGHGLRLAILLALAEGDLEVEEMQALLGVERCTVYRNVAALREASLVAWRGIAAKEGKGLRRVACLTEAGRQLVEALGGVAGRLARPSGEEAAPASVPAASRPVGGRVTVERGVLVWLLTEVWDYARWRLLHGLLDEEGYYAEERRIRRLALQAGVDPNWLETEEERGEENRGPTRGRRRAGEAAGRVLLGGAAGGG